MKICRWSMGWLMVALLVGCQPQTQETPASLAERLVEHNAITVLKVIPDVARKRPGLYSATSGQVRKLILQTDALFEPQSSVFKPGYLQILGPVVKELKARMADWDALSIRAYLDGEALPEQRLSLTRLQAEKIAAYLWFNGVPSASLRYDGSAKSHPISDDQTLSGQADNRRIEIILKLKDFKEKAS